MTSRKDYPLFGSLEERPISDFAPVVRGVRCDCCGTIVRWQGPLSMFHPHHCASCERALHTLNNHDPGDEDPKR